MASPSPPGPAIEAVAWGPGWEGILKSVFIALPAYGQMNCALTTFSLMALAKVLIRSGYDYYFSDYSFPDIAESRNLLTTIWIDRSEAEWMLFVDSDMGFEPQLVLDMLAFDKPLVGCMYPVRDYPTRYVGRTMDGGHIEGGFMQVEGIGFGVTLVRRDCIRNMLDSGEAKSDTRVSTHSASKMLAQMNINRIIRAFDPIETETGKLSEDLSFCRRHTKSSGEIWAATHHAVSHVGPHVFRGRFAEGMQA